MRKVFVLVVLVAIVAFVVGYHEECKLFCGNNRSCLKGCAEGIEIGRDMEVENDVFMSDQNGRTRPSNPPPSPKRCHDLCIDDYNNGIGNNYQNCIASFKKWGCV